MLLLAPLAAAQDADTSVQDPTAGIYMGDEPSAEVSGGPYCVIAPGDPSECAAGDSTNNAFFDAMDGDPDTVGKVFQVRWVAAEGRDSNDVHHTLDAFGLSDAKFLYGPGNFQGWFGYWEDHDRNKMVQLAHQSNGEAAIEVSIDPDRSCDTVGNARIHDDDGDDLPDAGAGINDEGDSPTGDDQEVSVDDDLDEDDDVNAFIHDDPDLGDSGGPEAHTGISARCVNEVEWAGIGNSAVVLYVTPGEFTDYANGPTGYETGGTITPGKANPDYKMSDEKNKDDTQQADTGHYLGPSAGFAQIWTDNGLIQTTITEGIADAVVDPEGARVWGAGTGVLADRDGDGVDETITDSVVDVDIYQSIAGDDIEGLYSVNVLPLYNTAGLGFSPDSWSPASAQRPAQYAVAGLVKDPVCVESDCVSAGATFATIVPPLDQAFPVGKTAADYLGTSGPYARVWASNAAQGYGPGVALAWDVSTQRTQDNSFFGLYGAVGMWNDKDGDGWIGDAVARGAASGCFETVGDDLVGDPHACGFIQDPNQYFGSRSNGEFIETCIEKQNGEGRSHDNYEWFAVSMTPANADKSFGERGVYVIKDEQRARANPDPITERNYTYDAANAGVYNQYSANPWDDIVYDVIGADQRGGATAITPTDSLDGLDRLVMSGTIQVHMVCTSYSGTPYYSSYEKFVLPGGNPDYAIDLFADELTFKLKGLSEQTVDFAGSIAAGTL